MLEVPENTPLGGYTLPRSSREAGSVQMGVLLMGRDDQQIAIVSAEILLFTPGLAQKVRSAFKQRGLANTLFTATHTHSGPGGFGTTPLERMVLGQDAGAERAILRSLIRALDNASSQPPSVLRTTSIQTEFLLRRTQSHETLDDKINLLTCGPKNIWVMHPAHPVTEQRMDVLHGDWPQLLMTSLRAKGFKNALYASSSGGEVSLDRPQGRETTVAKMVALIEKTLPNMKPIKSPMHLKEIQIPLPELQMPIHPQWQLRGLIPQWLLPSKAATSIQVLHHPTLDWFFMPYEASAVLWGPQLASRQKNRLLFHTPFNGDYVGYIVPQERHGTAGPEQLLSLMGPQAAARHLALLNGYLAASMTVDHQDSGTSPE
tara:strand:- start:4 stop:1125 length:1122 start_codon:yes stop_codon:yes gene_type:complete